MNKIKLGAFYTKKNPFKYEHIKQLPFLHQKGLKAAEPFSGAHDLIKHIQEIGFKSNIKAYDINPSVEGTIYWNSLKSIPKTDLIITNPPWLSKATATKKHLKVDFYGGIICEKGHLKIS